MALERSRNMWLILSFNYLLIVFNIIKVVLDCKNIQFIFRYKNIFQTIGVNWQITLRRGGLQSRPWVFATLIYEEVKRRLLILFSCL